MVAKLKKGWVGPLYQVKEGKRHWACDYIHPLSGKKKREWIAKAETNKKDREDRRHDFKRSLTDGRTLTQENATFNDALDAYLKWCEQLHKANDRMSAGTLERIGHTIRKHLRPDLGRLALWSSGHSGLSRPDRGRRLSLGAPKADSDFPHGADGLRTPLHARPAHR